MRHPPEHVQDADVAAKRAAPELIHQARSPAAGCASADRCSSATAGLAAQGAHLEWLFWLNLVLLILLGVGISGWLLRYTDWFPIVGGLLGLGGAFAWIAFLTNIVGDARKKQLQQWLDQSVLQRWHATVYIAVLAILGLGVASSQGTIVVEHLEGSADRLVRIYAVAAQPDAEPTALVAGPVRLTPGATQKHLMTTSWLNRTEFWIEVTGLPAIRETVRGWHRAELVVPGSFISRPVILVRPDAVVSRTASNIKYQLTVEVDGAAIGELDDYQGELVWIGCNIGVTVPTERRERWREELIEGTHPPPGWSRHKHIAPWRLLRPGQDVVVRLLKEDKTEYVVASATVGVPERSGDFPQEIVLHEKD